MTDFTPNPQPVILVADDDDDMRALVTATLRENGCSTLEARDGRELIDLLGEARGEPGLYPDVVVSDVKMPRLSGLGVLGALMQARWRLPVVMMTAVSDESILTIARRLGAVSILQKPFDAADLMTAVRSALATHGGRA